MSTSTKTRVAAIITGKGSHARTIAFTAIATCAYAYETGKQAAVTNLSKALGKSPSDALVAVAKQENTIGFATARTPASEFPKGMADIADRMDWVRERVTLYVAPAKEGTKAKKLRAGKLGYRSALVDRIIRNAEQATSKLFAELGLSNAKTAGESNAQQAAKRTKGGDPAPHHGKGEAADNAKPSHAELVKPAPATTQADYVQHMTTQLANLVAYDKKNARLRPIEFGVTAEGLLTLKQLVNTAANDYGLRMASAKA
jgi:hypothetical protein